MKDLEFMQTGYKIPFTGLTRQYNNLRAETLECIDAVLSSGQLMNGPYTVQFEKWLATNNYREYAVTCHSGTQALEIIAEYIRKRKSIKHTPTALIPSMTYVATANAFIRAGWDVHFVDVDRYGIFDFKQINQIPPYFDAVVLVGLYGLMPDCGNIEAQLLKLSAFKGDISIIEDAAQHWLSCNCQRIGLGTAISFDPTKNLANYGNGGAVITNDADLAFYAQGWRSNGQKGNAFAGSNSRMSEIDSATMMIKTKYIQQWQHRRSVIAGYWIDRLKGSRIRCLIDNGNLSRHSFHKFVIEVQNRDDLMTQLAQDGIETKIHYNRPLHELAQFHQYPGPGLLSTASAMSRQVLSLPIYPELTDAEAEYIIDQVLDYAA
jgi:dTDP-4-amino-4,6-dideoxygalactose transaminase